MCCDCYTIRTLLYCRTYNNMELMGLKRNKSVSFKGNHDRDMTLKKETNPYYDHPKSLDFRLSFRKTLSVPFKLVIRLKNNMTKNIVNFFKLKSLFLKTKRKSE